MSKVLTNVGAIKMYFSKVGVSGNSEDYKDVSLNEMKALSAEEREVLGKLCAKELGVEIGQTIED